MKNPVVLDVVKNSAHVARKGCLLPSFMRYKRVYVELSSDNALKRKLSKNLIAVCRPDQTSEDMPVEVVDLTLSLHEHGYDAYTMTKSDLIRFAHKFLIAGSSNLPTNQPTPNTMPIKSIEDTLNERLSALKSGIVECKQRISDYTSEMLKCERALAALAPKTEPEPEPEPDGPDPDGPDPELDSEFPPEPKLSEPKVEQRVTREVSIQNFETMVCDLLGRVSNGPSGFLPLDRCMFTHNRKNPCDMLTRSACYHRLRNMAKRKLIRYEDGCVYPVRTHATDSK